MGLSGMIRIGRTMILESLRGNGPGFNIVASQLHFWSRNEDHDDALTWIYGMGCNLANPHDMDI